MTTSTQTITYNNGMNTFAPLTINAVEYEGKCKAKDNNCFEMIPYDRPVKMYVDVDIKAPEEDGEVLLEEMPRLRGQVMNILCDYFGTLYDYSFVSISTSHSPSYRPYKADKNGGHLDETPIAKLSFHIVFNNIIALLAHQRVIVDELNEYANLHADREDMTTYFNKGMFDTAPYGKTQKLRSPYASKPYEKRPLVIEKGTFAMSCVSAFIPEEAKLIVREVPQKPIRDNTTSVCVSDEKDKRIFYRHIETGLLTQHAIKYNDWILIGWAIKNAFDDYQMWDDFSKLGGKKYDKVGVRDAWDNMERKDDGVGMGTINHYARKTDEKKANNNIQMEIKEQDKEDLQNARHEIIASLETRDETDSESDASEYMPKTKKSYDEIYAEQEGAKIRNYIKHESQKYISKSVLYNGYDTTMLFIDVFGNRFITCNEITYFYTGYVWKTCDKNKTDLHKFLCREFYMFITDLYKHWIDHWNKKMAETTDEQIQGEITARIKSLVAKQSATYDVLTSVNKRNDLAKEIIIQHTDNSLEFNTHNHLFAFKNAVFDLRKNEQIIPDPTHYISLYADYKYDNTYSQTYINELMDFLKIIHQNEAVRKYYLSIMATGLIGDHLQYFFIFTGQGGNGKGLTNKLFMKTISNYGYKAPNTLFTQELKTGACPEIANMNQKRFVCSQEPAKGGKLRMENIKEFTGENELNARQLYSSDTKTKMNNTMALEANTIPHTNEVGRAVERRLRIVPFLTNAIDKKDYDALEDKTNFCIVNPEYDTPEFLDKYKQAFFEILRPYVVAYYKYGDIPEMPELCRKATNAHLAISDDMNAWIEDNYEKCETAKPIKLKEVYDHFKATEAFLSLNKNQKREFNMATFTNKLSSSPFIAKYIKRRDERYNREKLKSDSLIGWKIKGETTDNDEGETYEMADV